MGAAVSYGGGFDKHLRSKQNGTRAAPPPNHKPAVSGTPRQTAWLLLKQPLEARPYLEELSRRCPDIAAAAIVAREFARLIRERDAAAWPSWLTAAKTTKLARFANHLRQDEAAVVAALQSRWSNGPVEGQVHRLKLSTTYAEKFRSCVTR